MASVQDNFHQEGKTINGGCYAQKKYFIKGLLHQSSRKRFDKKDELNLHKRFYTGWNASLYKRNVEVSTIVDYLKTPLILKKIWILILKEHRESSYEHSNYHFSRTRN